MLAPPQRGGEGPAAWRAGRPPGPARLNEDVFDSNRGETQLLVRGSAQRTGFDVLQELRATNALGR